MSSMGAATTDNYANPKSQNEANSQVTAPRADRKPRQRLDADARRAAILESAAEAFAALPFSEVRISAIAKAAGASDALLYRYFSGKDALYEEVARLAVDDLAQRQEAALASLPTGTPARERIKAATVVYLDFIAENPAAWAMPLQNPGAEPGAGAAIRAAARAEQVAALGALLGPGNDARRRFALWGFFGFLDAACLRWVTGGCRANERWPLIEAALGALEGALGDWAG